MFLLGHTGITLGAATVLAGFIQKNPSYRNGPVSWITSLGSCVDIRLLIIGSLLPDVIDKPLGQIVFRETFSNGRIFSHTLLFLVLITAVGFYLHKRHNRIWLLTLSFGTLMHLIFDDMWNYPKTLFWPLLGFAFERVELSQWLPNLFYGLFSIEAIYISEIIGGAILLWFTITIIYHKKTTAFLKHGRFY